MIRGYYTAASGLVTQEKKLNAIANNLTNANTVGYKRDDIIMGTFGQELAVRMNAYQSAASSPIGESVYMQVVDEKYTNHIQGGFEQTTRPLDMSIAGNGFFVVADAEGQEYLTRDGQFSIDAEGYLVLPGFGRVQGEDGDIFLDTSAISVDRFGGIHAENEDGELEHIDTLQIAMPDEDAVMEKHRNSLYVTDDFTVFNPEDLADSEFDFAVRQFNLERSNVNLSDEMTNMIASQRSLQSCSQIVKMYDELAAEITTRVSKI